MLFGGRIERQEKSWGYEEGKGAQSPGIHLKPPARRRPKIPAQ